MAAELRLTITEVADSVERQFGRRFPAWKLRRIVDSLESSDALGVQRIGLYRTVSADDDGIIANELRRLRWLESEAVRA